MRMPLAEANLIIHFPANPPRMPLAEANLIFTFPTNPIMNTISLG